MTDLSALATEIGILLVQRRETLAVAESCTGGFIANVLTNVPGASAWFERGVVCYSNASKIQWLGVSPHMIDTHGAVSRECVEAMAVGIRAVAGTTYGIAVTGIAGPSGGTPEKPVGTVFIGFAHPGGVQVSEHHFPLVREAFKETACEWTLDTLRLFLVPGVENK